MSTKPLRIFPELPRNATKAQRAARAKAIADYQAMRKQDEEREAAMLGPKEWAVSIVIQGSPPYYLSSYIDPLRFKKVKSLRHALVMSRGHADRIVRAIIGKTGRYYKPEVVPSYAQYKAANPSPKTLQRRADEERRAYWRENIFPERKRKREEDAERRAEWRERRLYAPDGSPCSHCLHLMGKKKGEPLLFHMCCHCGQTIPSKTTAALHGDHLISL